MIDEGYAILTTSPDSPGIAADWFEEQGRDVEASACRAGPADELAAFNGLRDFSYGFGGGFGGGGGGGFGFGGGGVGFGGGGFGFGGGEFGSGSGFGGRLGSDWGSKLLSFAGWLRREVPRMNRATVGECYLVFLPFGLAYVGRFVAPVGLTGGEFEGVSNVHDTNNQANWGKLAGGDKAARKAADFRKFAGVATFPTILAAHPWAGELP